MSKQKNTTPWNRFIKKFRAVLIAGLAVTVPIGLTVWIILWLFERIDQILQPVIVKIFGHEIIGVGFGVTLVLIIMIGIIATNVIGKRIVRWSESILSKVPITKTLYVAIKQIVQSFTNPEKTGFMQVVLIEFPVKGMKTIAFVTNEEIDSKGRKLINLFVPTAFNPTGGFMEIVREEDIARTDISVEEGLKLMVSGGSMSPKNLCDSVLQAEAKKIRTDS
jgi:uncharacterized membrane protein